jgi:hypothetical protein
MADSYALRPRLIALLEDMPLEELAFTPVPVRARHDGWTVERQKWFILRLALGGCVAAAARGVGMTPKSAYRLLDRPGSESFAAAWTKALGWGQERTLDRSLERALLGESVPIVRDGRVVGERHRFDNRLTLAVLNALDRRSENRFAGADPASVLQTVLAQLAGPDEKPAPAGNKGFSGPK